RIDRLVTMPPSEITATSVVPPPMSTTMLPVGSWIGRPAPIAAAIGSSMMYALRAPAAIVASSTARCSTPVMPLGTHSTTRGLASQRRRCTFWMKYRSIFSVTSKSAMTPSRSGRTATMCAGVRPIMRLASVPTARIEPVLVLIATTDGSTRVREKDLNLDIARRVQARLLAAGVPVLMTRTSDKTVSLAQRTQSANSHHVDIYVSIHNNGSTNHSAGGTEVYRQVKSSDSARLGGDLRGALARSPGLPTSLHARTGDHGDYYYVLRNTRMPA